MGAFDHLIPAENQTNSFGHLIPVSPEQDMVNNSRAAVADPNRMMPYLTALGGAAMQAVPFSDEFGSAAAATLGAGKGDNWPQRYESLQQSQQAMREGFKQDYPIQSTVAPVAAGVGLAMGGMMPSINAPAKVLGQTLPAVLRNIGTGAMTGGAYGTAQGLGEGDAFQSAGDSGVERLKNGAIYGTIGTALGGAIPAAIAGGKSALEMASNLAGGGNANTKAMAHLLRNMERAGTSPEQVVQDVAEQSKYGAPVSPIDVMGEQGKRLARTVRSIPSKGSEEISQFLDERQTGQGGRLVDNLRKIFADPNAYNQTVDDVLAARRQEAAPFYKAAFEDPKPVANSQIATLLQKPSVKSSIGQAYKIAAEVGENPKTLTPTTFNEAGDIVLTEQPNLKTLHYIREGLDDMIEKYRDTTTGKLNLDKYGRGIVQTRNELDGVLKSASPELAKGDQIWSGFSKMNEALQKGRSYMRGDVEELAKGFDKMTPTEQEMVRLGAAREARAAIEKGGDAANKVRSIFGSADKRAKLQTLFPDAESFKMFSDAMGIENQIVKTNNFVGGGSQTADKMADNAAANELSGMVDFLRSPKQSLLNVLGNTYDRARGIDENTAQQLANFLRQTDPEMLKQSALQLLEKKSADTATQGAQLERSGKTSIPLINFLRSQDKKNGS